MFIVHLRATCTFYDWIDLSVGLHTALCCSTLDPFSPKAKSLVSWLGLNKCSLLLTSYFSKKNYRGGKGRVGGLGGVGVGGCWNGLLCMRPPQSRVSFPHQPLLLIRMSRCFFSSRTAGAPLVTSELGRGLKCRLPCSEQHASHF